MPEAPYPPRLSDAELVSARLHVEEPRAEFVLLDQVPSNVGLAGIVASYDYHGTKLRCARPTCGVLHNKGFVVQLDTGQHIIIGHVCGKRVFGADWNAVEKDHEHLRERQRLLARRQNYLTTYDRIIIEIRGWRFQATAVQDAHRSFTAALPGLAAVLKQRAQRNNPALIVTVKVDQRALEAAREAQAAAGGRGRRQSDEREVVVHTLLGLEFFDTIFPRDLVENALTHLDAAKRQLDPDGLSNIAMRKALGSVTSAIEDLKRFVRMHGASRQALSVENIRGIVRWHQTTNNPPMIEMKHDTLRLHKRGQPPTEMRLPVIGALNEAQLLELERPPELR